MTAIAPTSNTHINAGDRLVAAGENRQCQRSRWLFQGPTSFGKKLSHIFRKKVDQGVDKVGWAPPTTRCRLQRKTGARPHPKKSWPLGLTKLTKLGNIVVEKE